MEIDNSNLLNNTPRSNRLHIGIYGRRNAGKSSLINAMCGHNVALVSDIAGTTTDPVYKSIELHGLGPCVLIDTAGFDDEGELGKLRVEKTADAVNKTDIAILLFSAECSVKDEFTEESKWIKKLREKNIPILAVLSKADICSDPAPMLRQIKERFHLDAFTVSSSDKTIQEQMRLVLLRLLPEGFERRSIVGHLIGRGDVVLLIMPQDIQAPEGRLILPQVQVIRDLLDHHAVVVSATSAEIDDTLAALKNPPALIITDSQVFPLVYEKKPAQSRLTSFSVLLAAVKGDIEELVKGASAVNGLTERSHVLIAEACTHAPLAEDIGRIKIPNMLKKRFGEGISINVVSGTDFPADLSGYDLIVHCGACMFNRKYLMSRMEAAKAAGIPMTNYGVLLAGLGGILDKITY